MGDAKVESKPDSANVRFPPFPLLYLGALLLSLFVEWLLGIRGAGPWRLAGLGLAANIRVPGGLIVGAVGRGPDDRRSGAIR